MNRLEILRKGISQQHAIVEIGPYFNPIAARAAGYRTTNIDVFDADLLRQKAVVDPNIPQERVAEIEDVDLLGSASDLADLARARFGDNHRFDWILSSHNIEHIPNPIRFLQQCTEVLQPEGTLRLAIPDKRFCFDHFRQPTEISEWLEAFFEKRSQPSVYQLFREATIVSNALPNGRGWTPTRKTLSMFREWFDPSGTEPTHYIDTHCWAFTPESFELLVRDTIAFGLVDLQVHSVSDTFGHEFFVDLRKPTVPNPVDEEQYYATREWLLRRCVDGASPTMEHPAVVAFTPAPRIRSVRRKVLREVARVGRQIKSLGKSSTA